MTKRKPFSFGPAILVTAAFIGPGTVMTASKAGSEFGFLLLWAVAFSVLATIVLQEMAARLGIVSGSGLSQALKSSIANPLVRFCILGLVIMAILIGNAAYQTGNILGAASGVMVLRADTNVDQAVADSSSASPAADSREYQNKLVVLIGVIALIVIWIGRFDILQGTLTLLVALMSLLFILAAIRCSPDWAAVASGFVPRVPDGGEWIVIGLVGTTVVPYNLFLHASAAAQRWQIDQESDDAQAEFRKSIASSRLDTVLSVVVGGLVTGAILVTAGVAFHAGDLDGAAKLSSVADVAVQLEPALGAWAKTLFAIGLFAAGLTSAITAPIAAGYAAAGCFGWPGKLSDWRLKWVATLVVVAGMVFGIRFGKSPQQTIILAQVANGLLLPIVAVFLLVIVNQTDLMGQYRNRLFSNVAGGIVIAIVALIAVRQFYTVGPKIQQLFAPVSMRSMEVSDDPDRLDMTSLGEGPEMHAIELERAGRSQFGSAIRTSVGRGSFATGRKLQIGVCLRKDSFSDRSILAETEKFSQAMDKHLATYSEP